MRVRAIITAVLALAILWVGVAGPAQANSACRCREARACADSAARALARGDSAAAFRFMCVENGHALWDHLEGGDVRPYVLSCARIASLLAAHGADAKALAWLEEARTRAGGDPSLRDRLDAVAARLRFPPFSPDICGLYVRPDGGGMWGHITVSRDDARHLRFEILDFRISPAWCEYGPAAYAEVEGRVRLRRDGTAEFRGSGEFDGCVIRFRFRPGRVEVSSPNEYEGCLFGAGVSADREFLRLRSSLPADLRSAYLGCPGFW